jgi:diacylglycerol kinase (ATP)
VKKNINHWARLRAAAGYSLQGLRTAWHNEVAFRQLSVLSLVLCAGAFYLEQDWGKRALLLLVSMLPPLVELLNSAIEAAVDHTSLERHPLAKAAKDMASAAQAISLLMVVTIWTSWLGS